MTEMRSTVKLKKENVVFDKELYTVMSIYFNKFDSSIFQQKIPTCSFSHLMDQNSQMKKYTKANKFPRVLKQVKVQWTL